MFTSGERKVGAMAQRSSEVQQTPFSRRPGRIGAEISALGYGLRRLALLMATLVSVVLLSLPLWASPPLKVDVLFVGAHPDDDSMATATLSRYAPRVAVVSATRGEGGGNARGLESGAALGVVRETEQRAALGKLGISQVYYLECRDFGFTLSAAAAEKDWGHDPTLERLVRYVRTLQPEVLITTQPYFGHGHHQFVARLATEAFLGAADPALFPDQLQEEGLKPWQPRKLLYAAEDGKGELVVEADAATLAREMLALREYRSQGWDTQPPPQPKAESFVVAFDLVGGPLLNLAPGAGLRLLAPSHPLVEGVPFCLQTRKAVWSEPPPGEPRLELPAGWRAEGLRITPNDKPGSYLLRAFWGEAETTLSLSVVAKERASLRNPDPDFELWAPAHGLSHLVPRLLPTYVSRVGEVAQVPVERYRGPETTPHATDFVPIVGSEIGLLPVFPSGLKANLAVVPSAQIPFEDDVRASMVWEGRVDSDNDLRAHFGMKTEGDLLKFWCQVRDDVVVSNLSAEDNRGHWRTDSVELAFDPAGPGASAHTLDTIKIAIVAFNLDGRPMAARDADANPGPASRTLPNLRLGSERTADGYRVVASVPWRDLGLQPGQPFGFNLMLYDADKASAAPGENANEGRTAWSAWPAVQGTPRLWGHIR